MVFSWMAAPMRYIWCRAAMKPLKAHRLHALKGQKLLAQGNALGIKAISNAPCKGNSFKRYYKQHALL